MNAQSLLQTVSQAQKTILTMDKPLFVLTVKMGTFQMDRPEVVINARLLMLIVLDALMWIIVLDVVTDLC